MFKRLLSTPKPVELVNLSGATAVYILLLVIPPPPFVSRTLNQSGWLMLLLLFCFLGLLLSKKGASWEGMQSVFVFGLFALLLVYKWQFASYDDFIIGGLQPWSDASAYLQEAQRLLHGLLLTTVGARRPLFHAFLAVLLYVTGGNFMVSLAVFTWINALAVLLVVREVRRSYGGLGASFVLLFAIEFYMRFAGTTMTEQLGLALGNLGVFFLLIAARDQSVRNALLGLGLLSVGLIARAGAFFILPILIVWIGITFRSKRGGWCAPGLAMAVVIGAFLLNTVLLKVIAVPQGIAFSNYSYTLYGLASGNTGWTQAGIDHPNATDAEVMPLAIQKIRSEPVLFLRGMLGSYRDYFTPDDGAFTFISFGSFRTKANIILWGLTLMGLVYAGLNWREGIHGLVFASFIGVFASVSLVPPIDANYMRAYAATIPFTAIWVVEGGYGLIAWGKKLLKQKEECRMEETGLPDRRLAIGVSAVLIIMAIPAAIAVRSLAQPSKAFSFSPAGTACGPGQQLLQGYMLKDISINLIPNTAGAESYMPFIRIGDYQLAVRRHATRYPSLMDNELLGLQAGQQISLGLDLNGGNDWLISSHPIEAGKFSACGKPADNPQLRTYGFYYLNGRSISPTSLSVSQQYRGITHLVRLLYGLGAGILLLLVALDISDFNPRSPANYLYVISAIILILQGVFVVLYARAIIHLPFSEQRITLEVKEVKVDRGLYILPLGTQWMSQADLGQSPAVVYENGIPLALPNSKPKGIRDIGNGRYSVTDGNLYFSSSDNTDPRTNGRKYELEWPRPIPPALQWIAYLFSLFGVAMLFFREWLTKTAGTWLTKFKERSVHTNPYLKK